MARLDSFLRLVVEQRASDLHFHAGNVPLIRHHGDLMRLPFRELSDTEAERFILEVLTKEQRAEFEREQNLDFLYAVQGVGRFRANVFVQNHGASAVFRVIPSRLPSMEELRLPGSVKKLTTQGNGLILVTGPTGAGKTTTLAAIIHEINRTSSRHIITIEDPIEFVHTPLQSTVTQRQVGKHTESFVAGLRSALREAPDVLMVGELRDAETISLAINAAETGVLVFATLHTNSATAAIDRIIDALPDAHRAQMRSALAVLLQGVVAQRLCKRADGDGRLAAIEILLRNWTVSHLIRESKIHQLEGYLSSANYESTGMQSLDSCLVGYVKDGLLTLEEARKASSDPEHLDHVCSDVQQEE